MKKEIIKENYLLRVKIQYVVVLMLLIVSVCSAQNNKDKVSKKKEKSYLTDNRKWTIELPLWVPGYRGDFVYGEVEIEGEDGTLPSPEHPIAKPGFGDVFKRLFKTRFDLNYFFVTAISYENKRFYGELDMFTGTLGSSLIFRSNNHKLVSASIHADLLRLHAGYNIFEKPLLAERAKYELCGYGGIRLHHFYVKTKINDVGVSMDIEPVWIEPVLGLRNELYFKNWKFIVQGDMGSFWIDGKYSYFLNLHSYYRMSNLLSVKVGWNSWYIYYKDRFKNENLRLKTHLAGPVAAIVFNF